MRTSSGHRGAVALKHLGGSAGFTLVEVLVAIGIIALLIAIIVPTAAEAQNKSRQLTCQANQRQLYVATVAFVNDSKGHLPCPSIVEDKHTDAEVKKLCVWGMEKEGVVNFNSGVIWKYLGEESTRRSTVWCPADNAEISTVSGRKPNLDRNHSYSMNANTYVNRSSPRLAMKLRDVKTPGEKIYIWEEQSPNDAWCLNPTTNNDDRPTGRHGRVGSLHYGTDDYNISGKGNYTFFDGHIESLSPEQINQNPGFYSPLK